MSHYYDNDPTLSHKTKTLVLNLNGVEVTLQSDRGVFSNKEVDEGSVILLKSLTDEDSFQTILDVGCGYGTLGLYLATKFKNSSVTMFDINERAVKLSEQNINLNKITNAQVYVANNYQALPKQSFDLIVLNPPIRAGKKVYYPLLSEARDYLTDGGKLVFVIRKSLGAESAQKYVKDFYSRVELSHREHGFYVYKASK